jgi:hypothetical protein
MTESVVARHGSSTAPEGWMEENDRGLALAADGDWAGAAHAFAAAADALGRDLPLRPATHEPLALVYGNLAHALFRDGRVEEAIQQAQRSCALRVAIAGEDGMPVAKARMDLSVMLAAAGRGEEAMALVQRALVAVEHRVGDEDVRLAVVLENAARIALAVGSPANAEPLLLRLHALLHAHALSTGRADRLLARVADVRRRQGLTARSQTPVVSSAVTTAAAMPSPVPPRTLTPRVAHTITPERLRLDDLDTLQLSDEDAFAAPREDQPLRDAVVLTDILLRTTPASTPGIPIETPFESLELPAAAVEPVAAPERFAPTPVVPARLTPTGTGIPPLDDRGPTVVLPTSDRGVRPMETPSRSSRSVRREVPSAPGAGTASKPEQQTASKATASSTPARKRSGSDAPLLAGLLAAAAAAGGALWWFLLR